MKNKDVELIELNFKKLKKENADLKKILEEKLVGFKLDDGERERLNTWLTKHNKKCKFNKPEFCGAIGGRLTYMFTPTSLGILVKVKCACEETIDLTDVSDW